MLGFQFLVWIFYLPSGQSGNLLEENDFYLRIQLCRERDKLCYMFCAQEDVATMFHVSSTRRDLFSLIIDHA